MADKIATIKRSDWIAVAASQTGLKTEDIDKLDKAIPGVITNLALEKINDGGVKTVIAETGLCAVKMNYHENGERTNADGTKTKVGPNVTINFAGSKKMLQDLNKGLAIGVKVAKAAPAIGKIIDGVKTLAA